MKPISTIILLALLGCPDAEPDRPSNQAPPERIVSLLPSFTEILTEIGCTDRLVGVTSFAPPAAADVRSVGGLVNPDLEAIFALEPDLVIGIRSRSTVPIRKKLEEAGIPVLFLPNETLENAMDAITAIGEGTHRQAQARSLRDRIEKEMAAIEEEARTGPRVRTAVAVQVQPLILAGKGSFLDELVTRAGGENIAADSDRPYPQFSLESFSVRAPEVIIDVSGKVRRGKRDAEFRALWARLPTTPAHESDRIHPLPPDIPIDPGPRVPSLMRYVAEKINGVRNSFPDSRSGK